MRAPISELEVRTCGSIANVAALVADRRDVRGADEQIDAADVREPERNALEQSDRRVDGRQAEQLTLASAAPALR